MIAHVMAGDPEATVAIFPSDRFIARSDRFNVHVERARLLAERIDNKIILFGAVPDRPEGDYGWIQPEHELRAGAGPGVWSVRSFHENPGAAEAAGYYRDGYLWNTSIMFAKARTLRALAGICGEMTPANLSTRILETCAGKMLVVTLDGVDWN